MNNSDGKDLVFAAAGLLWGTVTLFRGVRAWRAELRRLRTDSSCAVGALPITKLESPALIVMGAVVAAGCAGYLVWNFTSV